MKPRLDLDLRRLEPDLLDVRRPARGDEQLLGPELLRLLALRPDRRGRRRPSSTSTFVGVEAGVRHDRHAAPAEAPLERLADLAVLERDDRGQVLEQRHLRRRGRGTSTRTRQPTAPAPTTTMSFGSVSSGGRRR